MLTSEDGIVSLGTSEVDASNLPYALHLGDCLEVLQDMPSSSLDSMVTDPPAGIGFMGKKWDADKGGRDHWIAWLTEIMSEALRVLKPGGHALVWALPRTSGWTQRALEDAGFEVRDVVTHIFGSGFPKSLDVSKAIDKAAGAEREVVGRKPKLGGMTLPVDREHNFNRGKGLYVSEFQKDKALQITSPATPEALQWQGWGTALKPATEHWLLVRKPLGEKTVAKNVLKHGTGGLNIDVSRIGSDIIKTTYGGGNTAGLDDGRCFEKRKNWMEAQKGKSVEKQGRFPSNLIVDESAVAELDKQSGQSGGGAIKAARKERSEKAQESWKNVSKGGGVAPDSYGDTGGASRFFYVAKASRKDKNEGLDGLPTKQTTGGRGLTNCGDKFGSIKAAAQNFHPTVKSTALMAYLIKLITPPGGTVLDPFAGSGSTGVAAVKNGFRFVGVEKEAEYLEIASLRMAALTAAGEQHE